MTSEVRRTLLALAVLTAASLSGQQAPQLGEAPRYFPAPSVSAGPKEPVRRLAGAALWFDTTDRQTVASAYSAFIASGPTPLSYTGNVSAGIAGDTSAAYKAAVLQRINWVRRMAGVPDVTSFDPERNRKAQLGALMIGANDQLNHTPPTTWIYYTADGAEALGKSNLCYMSMPSDAGCVALYMQDHGSSNDVVGHRRWLLYPNTDVMGTGDVLDTRGYLWNVIWVIDPATYWETRPQTRSPFVAWPPPGYVPYQTIWPRWSFSLPGADFTRATVTMTRAGAVLPIRYEAIHDGYADNTLVWVPDNQDANSYTSPQPRTGDTAYEVTLRNVRVGGVDREYTYTVIAFDPTSSLLSISGRVTKLGTPLAGVTVSLSGGASQSATTDAQGNYSFANLNSGLSYTVTPTLANHTFSPQMSTVSNLQASQTGVNFAATATVVTISGQITAAGQPLSAVSVALSGQGTQTTGSAGTYAFTNVPAGTSYTVTPSHAFYNFSPQSTTFSAVHSDQVANFTGTLKTFTLSGTVLQGSTPLPGVTITVTGGANLTATSGVNGFSFPNLPLGPPYTVTPTRPGYQFQPASVIVGTANASEFITFQAINAPEVGLRFVPVTPCRIADTRLPQPGNILAGGTTRDFNLSAAPCGIPESARAFALNVTAIPQGSLGYLTVWPAGGQKPVASTLNSFDGRIKANAVLVPAGVNRSVSIYATNNTHVAIEVNGYFVEPQVAEGLAFYPVAPCRILDTRRSAGTLGGPALSGGVPRSFPVLSSSCGLPATAQAYSLNVTALPQGYLGYLTLWPSGVTRPVVSTLNAPTGAITANAAIVRAGSNGSIDAFSTNDAHIVVDVNGYFATPGAGGQAFYPRFPCRLLDTRTLPGGAPSNGQRDFSVPSGSCSLPAAAAYAFNATTLPQGVPPYLAYLTLWQQGSTMPTVSTLNALDGGVTSNMAIVPATAGAISLYTTNPAHVVLDNLGYFAP